LSARTAEFRASAAAAFRASVAAAPAPWFVTGLGTAAALAASFGHLTPTASVMVFSLATAAGTVITSFMTRPVAVPVISGAAAVILGDFALFGVHLNSDETGAVIGLVTFALGAFLHLAHVQYITFRPVTLTGAAQTGTAPSRYLS
jgi:hypothetical protein